MSDDPQDDSKPPSRISPLKAPIVLACFLTDSIPPTGTHVPLD